MSRSDFHKICLALSCLVPSNVSQVGGFAEVIVIFFLPGLVVVGAGTGFGASVVAFMAGAVVAGNVVTGRAAFFW
jgi:hypothetical protein